MSTIRTEDGRPMLLFFETPDGTRKMKELSKAQIGKRLAILLNGRLVQAGGVQDDIGDSDMITGSLTEAECCQVSCAFQANHGGGR